MLIGLTTRVDQDNSYKEIRDSVDTKWYDLLQNYEITPSLFPNNLEFVRRQLDQLNFKAFILTGGGDVVSADPQYKQAEERYLIEVELLKNSSQHNIPVLGICRGFQSMLIQEGGVLEEVSGHVASVHDIYNKPNGKRLSIGKVNSYHNFGISFSNLPSSYNPLAFDSNGYVESAYHTLYPWIGIMWHPERGRNSIGKKVFDFLLEKPCKNKFDFSWERHF